MKKFVPPAGHKCGVSSHIADCLTFGTGKLDGSGCWEHPCAECARAHEEQFPDDGPCWPHTDEQLMAMEMIPDFSTLQEVRWDRQTGNIMLRDARGVLWEGEGVVKCSVSGDRDEKRCVVGLLATVTGIRRRYGGVFFV